MTARIFTAPLRWATDTTATGPAFLPPRRRTTPPAAGAECRLDAVAPAAAPLLVRPAGLVEQPHAHPHVAPIAPHGGPELLQLRLPAPQPEFQARTTARSAWYWANERLKSRWWAWAAS